MWPQQIAFVPSIIVIVTCGKNSPYIHALLLLSHLLFRYMCDLCDMHLSVSCAMCERQTVAFEATNITLFWSLIWNVPASKFLSIFLFIFCMLLYGFPFPDEERVRMKNCELADCWVNLEPSGYADWHRWAASKWQTGKLPWQIFGRFQIKITLRAPHTFAHIKMYILDRHQP